MDYIYPLYQCSRPFAPHTATVCLAASPTFVRSTPGPIGSLPDSSEEYSRHVDQAFAVVRPVPDVPWLPDGERAEMETTYIMRNAATCAQLVEMKSLCTVELFSRLIVV